MDASDRVEADDPERCQGITRLGQCHLRRMPGSQYCAMHGGAGGRTAKITRNYRFTKYQDRLEAFADSSEIKNLREEVGVLRILLEEQVNACQSSNDLILKSGPISDLVTKIDRVVGSCHKIELATGNMLGKQAIMQLCNELVQVIGDEITDADVLVKISGRIEDAVARTLQNAEQQADF